MTPEELIKESIKNELKFCREIDCEKNDNGQYLYHSTKNNSWINLPCVLSEYKDWEDMYKADSLGYKVNPKFLDALKKASCRDK